MNFQSCSRRTTFQLRLRTKKVRLKKLKIRIFRLTSSLSRRLAYKLPTIDLFAPIKVKGQTNEKRIVRQNIKVLEDTFASFGIKVVVERAEIGPSVTRYELKPAVGVRVRSYF